MLSRSSRKTVMESGTAVLIILIQAAGIRRAIRSESLMGVPVGAGLGFLYSMTTISGPPIAVLFNNQGLVKRDLRAGLALIRVAESTLTAIAYYQLGLFAAGSFHMILIIAPGILIGIPLGVYTIRHVDADTFRRICMSFDAWIVGFGLSRVLLELGLVQSMTAYQPLMLAVLLDSYLLYGFFKTRRRNAVSITAPF